MIEFILLAKIFLVAFFINLLWEVLHSVLYETCLRMKLQNYVPLIVKMSIKDGLWIVFFYIITVLIFKNEIIIQNYLQLLIFSMLALSFSFIDERVSLKMRRWVYTKNMPIFFGVGLTPFLELAITGLLTFFLVFN